MIKKYQLGNGCASGELFEAGINVGATIRKDQREFSAPNLTFICDEEPGQRDLDTMAPACMCRPFLPTLLM
jgi:hypothetical protein